jgi:hypothetical protein
MIRDLTKSTISFSWALSLLGLRQAWNLLRPGQPQRSSDALGQVTQATVDQLDDSMKGVFRSGDNLQARAVDLAFASLNPINWINPGSWMRTIGNSGQQAANGQGNAPPYSPGGTQSQRSGGQGVGQQFYGQQGMGQQTGQGNPADAVLSWLNPFTWLNPNTWLGGGTSGGSCGCGQGEARAGQSTCRGGMGSVQGVWQAGADIGQTMGQAGAAMGQTIGQAVNQTAASFSGQQPQNTGGTANDSRSANWGPPR